MNQPPEGFSRESLLELATLSGISTEYHDINGELCRPSVRAIQSILRSMGHGDIESSLTELRGRPFNRLIEPCMAVFEDEQPVTIPLYIPCPEGREDEVSLILSLTSEDGTELETRTINGVAGSDVATHEGKRFLKAEVSLELHRECGYYDIEARSSGPGGTLRGQMLLIIAPRSCHIPEERTWGLTLSLYGIRSEDNWGIGDLGDLRAILIKARELGAGFVGVNPLHATPSNPMHGVSPYQPISRMFLNMIYADARDLHLSDATETQNLRDTAMVDYSAVSALKLRALRESFESFTSSRPENEESDGFDLYCRDEGRRLEDFATFMALSRHLEESGCLEEPQKGWKAWPEEYQDPYSPEVVKFKAEHAREVLFEKYVQWLLFSQLNAAAGASKDMPLGLYGDLAVGSLAGGSDAWTSREVFAEEMNMGAPPDSFSPFGQNWLFPPLVPERLRESGYRLFIDILRISMRHFSALRIDHALGLFRTFWIPEGMGADEGTYVSCPHEELLKIIALESRRSNTMIIAEDLGTIGENVRESLASYSMLSYRLLYFERNWENGTFLPAESYPRDALAAVNSHDLPPLRGFWEASDIRERQALGLYPDEQALETALSAREEEKSALAIALAPYAPEGMDGEIDSDTLLMAAHSLIAQTPSLLAAMSLDDALGVRVQQNLPGVDKGHPNWMRKYPINMEWIFGPEQRALLLSRIAGIFNSSRG